MKAFLILMTLVSVQGIRQPGKSYKVKSGDELVDAFPPEFATCMPTYQVVPFGNKTTDNTFVEYYPSCTRVRRCSGCCHNRLFQCQAATTELKNFVVSAITYDRNMREQTSPKEEVVTLEEHTSCTCSCGKTKKCRRNQKFDPRDCSCECKNYEEQIKCSEEKEIRYWDPQECTCACKHLGFCDPAYEIRDPVTCRCEKINYESELAKNTENLMISKL